MGDLVLVLDLFQRHFQSLLFYKSMQVDQFVFPSTLSRLFLDGIPSFGSCKFGRTNGNFEGSVERSP